MKLQRLSIHNLASITDATIDFSARPLADSEVFLITGKTGAGKSTLLDAICLALFADTPRLESSKMEGEIDDGGKDGKSVRIKDTRQLMRHNTGSCFARLSFIGSNGVAYEATWSAARAHGKVTGNMQAKRWTLQNLDTGLLLTKDADIRAEMKEAVGLDFKQFRRTTLLAQGEFTQFLNSRDNEKAEILEKITGAAVYRTIGQKVYALTEEKRKEWETVRNRIAALQVMTGDEVEELSRQRDECEKQAATLRSLRASLLAKQAWVQTDGQLNRSLETARKECDTAQAQLRTDDFLECERTLQQWDATVDPRQWLASQDEVRRTCGSLARRRQNLRLRYSELKGGHLFLKNEAESLRTEVGRMVQTLERDLPMKGLYTQVHEVTRLLTALDENRVQQTELKRRIAQTQEKTDRQLQPAFRLAQERKDSLARRLDTLTSQLRDAERQLDAMQLPRLREEKEKLQLLHAAIAVARERMAVVAAARTRLDEAARRADASQKQAGALRKQLEALEPKVLQADAVRESARALYEQQRETVSKWARSIRRNLKVGDVCPVCRQHIQDELPHEDTLDTLLAQAEKAKVEADRTFESLTQQRHALTAQCKALDGQTAQARSDASDLASLRKAQALMDEALRSCGMDAGTDRPAERLMEVETDSRRRLESLQLQIAKAEAFERQVAESRSRADQLRKQCDEATEAALKAGRLLEENRQLQSLMQNQLKDRETDCRQVEADVLQLLAPLPADEQTLEQPRRLAEQLEEKSRSFMKRTEDTEALRKRLSEADDTCNRGGEVLDQVLHLLPEWDGVEPGALREVPVLHKACVDLQVQVAALLEQEKVQREKADALDLRMQGYMDHPEALPPDRLRQLSALSPSQVMQMREHQSQLRNLALSKKTLSQAAQMQWNEHQKQRPEMSGEETAELLAQRIADADGQAKRNDERKGAIEAVLKKDADNKRQAHELLDEEKKRKELYERWTRLDSLIGDAQGATFRKIAQSYVLQSLIHAANVYLRRLTDRYQLRVLPGTFVISVVDAYQGYTIRAASTISGGESFLVSLSLALALSDIGQRLSVDTLFIDEGFGTLSGEPLQRAVDTLRALHTQVGRHVGIISHVEELRERIPVQIQVVQEGNDSASTIRVCDGENL